MSAAEAIKTIVSVEENARQIVEDARNKAAEMRRQAENQRREVRLKILESAKREADEIRKKAHAESEREAHRFLEESMFSRTVGADAARMKIPRAVEAVVKLVLEGTR